MLGRKFWGIIIALTLFIMPFGMPSAQAVSIRIGANATTTTAVNFRSGAGTNYAVQYVLPAGTTVRVDAGPINASWYKVTHNGRSGYVYGTYLRQGSEPTNGGTGTGATTARVNFRTGPGLNHPVQLVIPAGAQVSILSGPVNSTWYQIGYAGRTGYVHSAYITRNGNGGGTGSGKLIVVDISDQWVYAYEGGKQVFAAPTSTGKDGFNTPVGTYQVLRKLRTDTMRGNVNGESWYAENVPYVMYFTNRGHALHGAPWLADSVFGSGVRRSHGCVNLKVDSAAWFYNWAPIGTTVHVRW